LRIQGVALIRNRSSATYHTGSAHRTPCPHLEQGALRLI